MNRMYRTLPLMIAAGFAVSLPAFAADTAAQPAAKDAQAQTKVSEADARKTALASIPSATVVSSKLVTEKGRQVWAYELKSGSSKNDFVIQVDANSGRIVGKSVKSAQTDKAKKS